MDTQIVEVRKNIAVSRTLAAVSSFSANINIDFIPDEVYVRFICFEETGGGLLRAVGIYTDLVNDIIGSFSSLSVTQSDIVFTLKKPINGLYNFQIMLPYTNINTPGALQPVTGDLFIHLDFVKYKSTKQEKIY